MEKLAKTVVNLTGELARKSNRGSLNSKGELAAFSLSPVACGVSSAICESAGELEVVLLCNERRDKFLLTRSSLWLIIGNAMKKKIKNDKTIMTAREVAVLIERLRSEFKVFGDELKTIARKTEGIEITVARTWEKITEIDLLLIRLEKKVDSVDKRLAAVEALK